ncbi:cyclic nucleotide-binding domain-containing protein [Cohnella xylanilytica]|uniref:Cyclic nucleotide-binding domain-containing protein n=1 Tax=Cohnella xylanilytica TaxID=557555 RepID=A0A841U4Q7_9BACL|nr:cyclic nucleotide-binding domain-containing protein [Cohnella xylanilytica]MBB6695545.1 cyclic nucleotide-binding domain-containing protein [Cohnella xylanilytica]
MKEWKDPEAMNGYLRRYRIESALPEELLPHLALRKYEPDERLCSQGDKPDHLYLLVEGKLRVSTSSAEGRTLVLTFHQPPELIGEIEFARGADYLNTVEAVTPVVAISAPYRYLSAFALDHPPFLRWLLDVISRKFWTKSESLSFNLMHPVETRLAGYLLSRAADCSGTPFQGRLRSAELKDAANAIGTSYRHLNRVIGRLCAEGLLERVGGHIVVKDRRRLQELVDPMPSG